MIITAQELWDYMRCPLHYYFKHIKKFDNYYITREDALKIAIEKTIKHYYYTMLDNQVLSPYLLKTAFNHILREVSKGVKKEDVKKNSMDVSLETKGLGAIMGFYKWAQESGGYPIDIDREYLISIGDHKLSGKLGIVRQVSDNTLDILDIKTWESVPDDFIIDTDLEITLNILAARSIYGVDIDKLTIFLTKSSRELTAFRTEENFQRFINTAKQVIKCIENEIYFPRWNVHCRKCNHQELCKHWYK